MAMRLCVRGINFSTFYDFPIGIWDCSNSKVFLVFYFIIIIINIFVGEVQYRLTGGKDQNSGRIEININGVWGTMCDDEFDATSAKVLCKQLGLPS